MQSLHNELATLQQPVYLPEARHNFSEIGKHVDKLEKLEGPIYDIKRDHHFKEIREAIQ